MPHQTKFHIGFRTIKTALSVFLCVVICKLISRDSPVLSCLAAVYCLRSDTSTSYKFSKHRLFGTTVGALVSTVVIFFQTLLGRSVWVDAGSAALAVIVIILFCVHMKHPEGTITSVSTMLIICFNTPKTETAIYAIFRIFDVLLGAMVAIVVDYSLPSKNRHQVK